ncbi:hypothetical protein CMV_000753 [Castanea mollissima]|uniref:Uncharacterized protein n=1 Tax=Castanea mollissima TaxID=60419 RepID=A0A8J4S5A2_9ROSI|nr:hypothetical protein CMV_000753 [Castanea mollissima]
MKKCNKSTAKAKYTQGEPLGKRLYIQAKIGGKWPILLASLDLIGFQKDDLVQQYYRVLKSLAYDNRQELVIPQRESVLQLCCHK